MTTAPAGPRAATSQDPPRPRWDMARRASCSPRAAQGQALLRVPASGGTRLDSINELVYSTYRSSVDAGGNLAIALQFAFDFDLSDASDGFQGRLVYEPYHTNGGAVTQGAWQTWDALAGKWWVTRPSSVTPAATCVQATPCSLAQLLVAYPNAGIHKDPASGIVLKAGSGWATFDGSLDALRVGINGVTTQYDFEDTPQCTTDCYVSPSGNDLNGGTSYADAKKTIQAAIDDRPCRAAPCTSTTAPTPRAPTSPSP